MGKTAIVLGASGLTGSFLLELLLEDIDYHKIIVFTRKPLVSKHAKIEAYVVDLLNLKDHSDKFKADVVYCCIGTTKAKTPNKKAYRTIDYGIPLEAAKLCVLNAIDCLVVISSMGANAKSSVFYNRTKGQMEDAILALNIPFTYILRPSLIEGKRQEKRLGEWLFKGIMKLLNPFLFGWFKNYQSINYKTIAKAMIIMDKSRKHSVIVLSATIKKLVSNDS